MRARRIRDWVGVGSGGRGLAAAVLVLPMVDWETLAMDSRKGALKSSWKRGLLRGCRELSGGALASLRLDGLLRNEGNRATDGDIVDDLQVADMPSDVG